jgi:hypothetical protein
VPRHLGRVFGKYGRLLHIALFQAYAMSVFEIDSRYKQHGYTREFGWWMDGVEAQGFQFAKLRYSCKPADALFSG